MENKDAKLGRPSYVWRSGQERRLRLIQKYISLQNKKILDVGCGQGLYLKRLKQFTDQVFGIDIDKEKIKKIKPQFKNVQTGSAENLPYPDRFFDLILFNEVLEHVENDKKAIQEGFRCLKKEGKIVIFAPNRLFPFETHGIYFKGKYHFGNYPLVNYLPSFLRKEICPHVRTYTKTDLLNLLSDFNYKIQVFTQIYPGFDRIETFCPILAKILRKIFYFLEKTPLRIFGLSHFLILKKD